MKKMLRCVYMMLLGIPISVSAVTLMKKLPMSSLGYSCLLGVLSVRPDLDFNSAKIDYGNSEVQLGSPLNTLSGSTLSCGEV
ncbi:unnamed protein product [Camellia sinensis]